MAISLTVGTPVCGRDGNQVNISIPITANMTEGSAYKLRVTVNGEIWKTGATYGNVSGTFIDTAETPASFTRTYLVAVEQQASVGEGWSFYTSKTVTAEADPAVYTVTFDPGDGVIVGDSSKAVSYGLAYGDMPRGKLEHHRFQGWYTADGEFVGEDDLVAATDDHTLYAQYQALSGGASRLTIDEDTHAMSMVRGDSEALIVKCSDDPFVDGDTIEFTVRKRVKSEKVIHKTVTEFEEDEDGAAYIEILPEDTSELEFGDYVYDIQLTKANGWVTTLIKRAKFTLEDEVTYNG